MKIAYLSTFQPFRGGIAQFNAALYRAFEKKNKILAFNFKRQYPEMLFPGSTQYVTDMDKVDKISNTRLLDTINPFSYFTTAKAIKRTQPDMMVMKFWMPFFAPSLGTVSFFNKRKTKIIAILDNVIPHERRMGDILLTKFFLNQCHAFVVMSDKVKEDLLTLKPNARFIYHPHPLYDHFGARISKAEACKILGIPENKKTILFFGFIRGYKGLDLLLKAAAQLSNDYHIVIAGEVYGSFDEYQQTIDQLQIAGKTSTFIRYISDNEVPAFFSAADVCVLPYKSATQSGITAIAYHFNVPVIATDVGGLKESIKHNETGLIVDDAEPAAIANAIQHYFNNNLAAQFSTNINRLKAETYWQHLAESIVEFSEKL